MCLHQGTDILINCLHAVMNITNLKTINNVQIPTNCIVTKPTKLTGKCITAMPCLLEMEVDEIITIQNPPLVMYPKVHLKDKLEPVQIPLTLIHLSHDAIQIAKYTVMETFWLYVDYQELQSFEICHLNVKVSHYFTLYSAKC